MIEYVIEPDRKQGFWVSGIRPSGSRSKKFYATADEAQAALDAIMALPKCVECGDPCRDEYTEPYKTKIHTEQKCFTCISWTESMEKLSDPETAIIENQMFRIGESEASIARRCNWPLRNGRLVQQRHVLGHGGADFTIKFNDGREVTTTNLWAGGEIPEHFRSRFPNNAVFVSREVSAAYVGIGSASC